MFKRDFCLFLSKARIIQKNVNWKDYRRNMNEKKNVFNEAPFNSTFWLNNYEKSSMRKLSLVQKTKVEEHLMKTHTINCLFLFVCNNPHSSHIILAEVLTIFNSANWLISVYFFIKDKYIFMWTMNRKNTTNTH